MKINRLVNVSLVRIYYKQNKLYKITWNILVMNSHFEDNNINLLDSRESGERTLKERNVVVLRWKCDRKGGGSFNKTSEIITLLK